MSDTFPILRGEYLIPEDEVLYLKSHRRSRRYQERMHYAPQIASGSEHTGVQLLLLYFAIIFFIDRN